MSCFTILSPSTAAGLFHVPVTSDCPIGRRPEFELISVEVISIRDLVTSPLTVAEFRDTWNQRISRRKLLLRSQGQPSRWVYQRSIREYWRQCPLRVGIFGADGLIELLASNWGPNLNDRRALLKFLSGFDRRDFENVNLGVFSDDGELIS